MNEENITKRSLKDWSVGKTNLSKLDAISDEQNMANSLADKDAQPVSYGAYEETDGFLTELDVRLDHDVYYWIKNKGLSTQQYVNALLHQQMQQHPPA